MKDFNKDLKDAGMNQVQFAELCGVSLNTVSNWKKTGLPTMAKNSLLFVMAEREQLKATSKLNQKIEVLEEKLVNAQSISYGQYYEGVKSRAEEAIKEAFDQLINVDIDDKDQIIDDVKESLFSEGLLREMVDCDEWSIYYHYHLSILQHTDSFDAIEDYDHTFKDLRDTIQAGAQLALYDDIANKVSDIIDNVISECLTA